METTKLNNLLSEYLNLQSKEEEIKSLKENLKKDIISLMGTEKKYSSDSACATIINQESFKYNDETAMINWLKNNGYSSYVKEKIDTGLNKILKTPTPLTEALQPYYSKTIIEKLKVESL